MVVYGWSRATYAGPGKCKERCPHHTQSLPTERHPASRRTASRRRNRASSDRASRSKAHMDLRLFWGVVKRYKRLAIGGTLVAALLAILAYGTPSLSGGMPTIVPHTPPVYQSQAQLLIAQGNGIY